MSKRLDFICFFCFSDLKLENILMNRDGTIKIADFGLSNTIKFGQKMGTACGTPSYTAPEMV